MSRRKVEDGLEGVRGLWWRVCLSLSSQTATNLRGRARADEEEKKKRDRPWKVWEEGRRPKALLLLVLYKIPSGRRLSASLMLGVRRQREEKGRDGEKESIPSKTFLKAC